ncbi:hypothetical protein DTL42_25445 [Bremerella cremea]|uniref:Uncharacterized protein n=1 Tax=Bremerella cremea TaxID=1031537 RepID=A0A368KJG4_9BACT|nr:hypothetical protein [Bremerella cremea]RCS40711.1 hypothetical protein DTL42_25445 [Bremerella cremea]
MLQWIRAFFASPPVCPVNEQEREWIDDRFAWLIEEFGMERLRQGITVLPTTQFFPGHYRATEDEIHHLLVIVAQHMDVDPDCLWLSYYGDGNQARNSLARDNWQSTKGLYSEVEESGFYRIQLNVDGLNDPLGVVATLAHEIGHVRLLGEDRVSREEHDHEPLTDLLTVFLGLGICTANSVIQEGNWNNGAASGWSMSRCGYLSMNMYGYALGLYALARREWKPAWLKYLRPDVRHACRNTIRLKLAEKAL